MTLGAGRLACQPQGPPWPHSCPTLHSCPPSTGRTYRYWRGEEPLYPFGYGLSFVDFKFGAPTLATSADGASATVQVSNGGAMPADTAVLLLTSFLGPDAGGKGRQGPSATLAGSGCAKGVAGTDLVQRLVDYQRTGTLAPGASASLTFRLRLGGGSKSAWAGFGDAAPPCGAYALRFGADEPPAATLVLAP